METPLDPNRSATHAENDRRPLDRRAGGRPPATARCPSSGYLKWFVLLGLASFALCWLYVALAPMTFMDAEYPRWRAKETLLARCDFGAFAVVGDSRAAVDIAPVRLPMRVTNLALAGTTPIETYVMVARALRCAQPPPAIIISISPSHVAAPDTFWGKSVRYGFLSLRDLFLLRDISLRLHNTDVLQPEPPDGLSITPRILLYEARFPALYFGSLYHNVPFLPYRDNQALYAKVLRSRGQYYFASRAGPTAIGPEGELRDFVAQPVLDAYFNRILALTASRGIPVYFIAMPLDADTYDAVPPAEKRHFADYLRRYAAKYPNFHVATEPLPHWPNRYFADWLSHMNPTGVAVFNRMLAQCLARIATKSMTLGSEPACPLGTAPPG